MILSKWLGKALAFSTSQIDRFQVSISWRLYAMLVPTAAAAVWVGLEARAGLAGNASALIEARQVKETLIESRGFVLVQDEASKAMIVFPEDTTAMNRKIQAFDGNIAALDSLNQRVRDSNLRALVRRLRSVADNRLAPADTDLSEAAAGGDRKKASDIYKTRFLPARLDYDETVRLAAAEAERLAGVARLGMAERNRASLRAIVLALFLGIGTSGAGLVLLFRRSIVRPLGDVCRAMAVISDGDLSQTVPVIGRDEIGRLGEAVNTMAGTMRNSIHGIAGASRALASQADSLQQVSRDMELAALRASDEAAHVSEAGRSVRDSIQQSSGLLGTLTQSIGNVARGCENAAVSAGEAARVTRQTREAVSRLDECSGVIDAITEAMDRVAFETNVLGLNAAIEAARHGAAGRGFAVVAKQIRTMAEQTKNASTEISQRVQLVHAEIAKTVSGISEIETSIERLASGASAIAGETRSQGTASGMLDSEVKAMVLATSGISHNLAEVSQVLDHNRAGAQQTHNGAGAVAASARELDRLVGYFQT